MQKIPNQTVFELDGLFVAMFTTPLCERFFPITPNTQTENQQAVTAHAATLLETTLHKEVDQERRGRYGKSHASINPSGHAL
jgi:hypothetical protein